MSQMFYMGENMEITLINGRVIKTRTEAEARNAACRKFLEKFGHERIDIPIHCDNGTMSKFLQFKLRDCLVPKV